MECRIRSWKLEDAPDLKEILSNPNVLKNLRDGIPYPYTLLDAENYIKEMQKANTLDIFAFAIEYAGKVIGSITCFRGQNIHKYTAEIGYYLREDYWSKGIMTQAVCDICSYVFSNSDIMRIYATPFKRNIGSCKVLEKAGFVKEGIMRCSAVKDKIVEDIVMYSKIK